jgi:hypothetical protein
MRHYYFSAICRGAHTVVIELRTGTFLLRRTVQNIGRK